VRFSFETQIAIQRGLTSGESIESLVRSLGPSFLCDAEGRTEVRARDREGTALAAIAPGLFGTLDPDEGQLESVTLELHPLHALEVRVLHADGAPASGTLASLAWQSGSHRSDVLTARCDAEGRARILVPRAIFRDMPIEGMVIAAMGLFREPVFQPLHEEEGAFAPVELRLPACGSVALRLRPGAVAPRELYCQLSRIGEGGEEEGGDEAPGLGGKLGPDGLQLRPVEIGLALEARASATGSRLLWKARGTGPSAAGECVELLLEPPAAVKLLGRALDESGRPLARSTLRGTLETALDPTGSEPVEERIASDEEGRFSWELPADLSSEVRASLRLRRRGIELTARLKLPAVLAGEHDLGSVVLSAPPLLARGRLIDASGAPVPGARIQLLRSRPTAAWHQEEVRRVSTRSGEDGRFALQALPPEGELSLRATAPGFLPSTRDIQVGEEVGDWTLGRQGGVRGRILLDPDIPASELRVEATPFSSVSSLRGPVSLQADGSFHMEGLGLVPYRFKLEAEPWAGPGLVLWERVLLGAEAVGAELDLGTFDARGRLASTRLRIEDASGRLVRDIHIESPMEIQGPGAHAMNLRYSFGGLSPGEEEYRVWHLREGSSGEVFAHRFRRVPMEFDGGRHHLTMRPALPVRIDLEEFGRLPAGVSLAVKLSPSEGEGRSHFLPMAQGTGEFHLDAAGTYRLGFYLGSGGSFGFEHSSEGQSIAVLELPELQTFRVAIPPDLLARAEEMARPK
jgi:hypothetical protein